MQAKTSNRHTDTRQVFDLLERMDPTWRAQCNVDGCEHRTTSVNDTAQSIVTHLASQRDDRRLSRSEAA
jgi:hypothetical protein